MPRNYSIDLIKIIAMYMVILLHVGVCRNLHAFRYLPATFTIAGIAIPMFSMVSGYLLSSKASNEITFSYCIKKIWGILKFCIIICAVFDVIKYVTRHELELSFPQCLIKEGSFSVFWYFGTMIVIYLILPLLMRIISHKYFDKTMLIFAVSCFILFGLNYFYGIENKIPNTFRLLNWVTYFLLGAYINRYHNKLPSIKWYYPIISGILFSLSVIFGRQPSYELHFSSPLCMVYAISTFCFIIHYQIKENIVIKSLASCFLPIYALHLTIIWRLFEMPIFYMIETKCSPVIGLIFGYVICAIVCTMVSFIIMKIPYMDRIFKI